MKKKKTAKQSAAKPAVWKTWVFGWLMPGLLVTLPALIVTAGTNENFRLPKLLLSELLVLLTLAALSLRLRSVGVIPWGEVLRKPVVLATGPLLLVAALSLAFGEHRHHGAQAMASLAIGAVGLVGWSLGLRPRERERVFRCLLFPASLLALVGVLQFHDLAEIFRFQDPLKERIGVTSLAGGAFDLSAYLLLPALIAQRGMALAAGPRGRVVYGLLLALFLYAIAITQTLSVLVAVLLGSLGLWFYLVPRRRFFAAAGIALTIGALLVVTIGPLRQRVSSKLGDLQRADLNRVLTGRLDGWRAAGWMFEQHPLLGVGHGAYRAEFGFAKLALKEEGVQFYRRQHQPYFVNAHNEILEVAAETGALGLGALFWGLFCLARAVRHRVAGLSAADRGFLVGVLVVITIVALTNFPFRIALVAYPMIFFLSWIFAEPEEPEE